MTLRPTATGSSSGRPLADDRENRDAQQRLPGERPAGEPFRQVQARREVGGRHPVEQRRGVFGRVHVQAGGGIVADSDPDYEVRETEAKAGALVDAIALACAQGDWG